MTYEFDAYAGWTLEDLKTRCIKLSRAIDDRTEVIEKLLAQIRPFECAMEKVEEQGREIQKLRAHHDATMSMLHTNCADGCKFERLQAEVAKCFKQSK